MHSLLLTFFFFQLSIKQSRSTPQDGVQKQQMLGIPSGSCRWVPEQKGWPSQQEWDQLNLQVKGRLIQASPPAARCHQGVKASADSQSCTAVKDGFADSAWHAKNPVSNMWQNYNNYSCMPTAGPCTIDGYPLFVVKAKEATDVKAAVDFAREKNIRLNIKSTGHDFLGRYIFIKTSSYQY